MRIISKFLTLFMVLFIRTEISSAQNDTTVRKGISVPVQNSDFGISFVITKPSFSISPGVYFINSSGKGTDWGFNIAVRKYLNEKIMRPFIGGRTLIFFLTPKKGSKTQDYLIGVMVGGEVFIHKFVSLLGELQMNTTFSHDSSGRFGNQVGRNTNTGSSLFINLYF